MPCDRLEILFGNDHIRIDIGHIERGSNAGERGELVHGDPSFEGCRGSTRNRAGLSASGDHFLGLDNA